MRISVIGCGYLGAVHAAALARLGHDVVGVDLDERKVAMRDSGLSPCFEPGLPELLLEGLVSGRLRFSTSIEAARGAAVHSLALGTPQGPNGSVDLSHLLTAVADLLLVLREGDLVVGKSTVPVGMGRTARVTSCPAFAERQRDSGRGVPIAGVRGGRLHPPRLCTARGRNCAVGRWLKRSRLRVRAHWCGRRRRHHPVRRLARVPRHRLSQSRNT